MEKIAVVLVALFALFGNAAAANFELDDGSYVDSDGEITDYKYKNEDMFAPWNDPLKKDDMFAPWNDPLKEDDMFAPWNNEMVDRRETNEYLRKNEVKNPDYYWKR